ARGRSLELAPHRSARHLPRHRRRIPILHDHRRTSSPGIPALSRAHPPHRSPGYLDCGLSLGHGLTLRRLLLPTSRLPRRYAARLFLGSDLARFYSPRRLSRSRIADPARLPRPGIAATSSNRNLLPLAAHPLFWQHRSRARRAAVHRTGPGTSPRSRRRIPARFRPIRSDLCFWYPGRLDGNTLAPTSDRIRLGISSRLRPLEPPSPAPSLSAPSVASPT